MPYRDEGEAREAKRAAVEHEVSSAARSTAALDRRRAELDRELDAVRKELTLLSGGVGFWRLVAIGAAIALAGAGLALIEGAFRLASGLALPLLLVGAIAARRSSHSLDRQRNEQLQHLRARLRAADRGTDARGPVPVEAAAEVAAEASAAIRLDAKSRG